MYFTKQNQSVEGQIAVAQVVIDRVGDTRYPNTVCEVVYQRQRGSWKTRQRKFLTN